MEAVAEIEERMQRARRSFDDLKAEMARMIVGHQDLIEQVFIALVCGGHCLLEGVPGLGKTLMVRSLGEILSLSFSRIQFTPDLMPADITGTNVLTDDPSGRKIFEFQRGPVFAHIVLADEIKHGGSLGWTRTGPRRRAVAGSGFNQGLGPRWWVLRGSNPRPTPCKGAALPTELSTRGWVL